jgi:acetyl esterase/lipase
MKPSLLSVIFAGMLKMLNFKKIVEKQARKKIARSKKGFMPNSIRERYSTATRTIRSREIATFEKKEKVTKTHLIYFHGGAYIFEASPFHWRLAQKIVEKSFCRMTLVDYPLAPEHSYRETFDMVEATCDLLLSQYPGDRFFFMGDSAGGGLALALAQKLASERPVMLPTGIILLSPWLDLALSNPAVKDLERSDHILTVDMLRHAGAKYANGADPDHYLLSPINGTFNSLPKALVFYGTEELFYADCTKLRSIVSSFGDRFQFREYAGMQHDWAILPLPESKRVVDEICSFIQE